MNTMGRICTYLIYTYTANKITKTTNIQTLTPAAIWAVRIFASCSATAMEEERMI